MLSAFAALLNTPAQRTGPRVAYCADICNSASLQASLSDLGGCEPLPPPFFQRVHIRAFSIMLDYRWVTVAESWSQEPFRLDINNVSFYYTKAKGAFSIMLDYRWVTVVPSLMVTGRQHQGTPGDPSTIQGPG